MAEHDEEGASNPPKRVFDITKLLPKFEYGNQEYCTKANSVGFVRAVKKRNFQKPDELVRFLIEKYLTLADGKTPLDEGRVDAFANDGEFLEKLIQTHPDFYSERRAADTGGDVDRALIVERGDGESAAEYLFRAVQDYARRVGERDRAFSEQVTNRYNGLAKALSRPALSSLMRNMEAAERMEEILRVSPARSLGNNFADAPSATFQQKVDFPDLQPPVAEMKMDWAGNSLGDMHGVLEEMRELNVIQAELQKTLNDIIVDSVDKFVKGAEASRATARLTLIVSAVAVGISIFTQLSGNSNLYLAGQNEIVALLGEIRDSLSLRQDR